MRLCRFDHDRLGVVCGDEIRDVTAALKLLPELRWPLPPGDPLIANLGSLLEEMERLMPRARCVPYAGVELLSPIANPSKIIAAPLNYEKHVGEVARDPQIHAKTHVFDHDGFPTPVDKLGLFLKAGSSLTGPAGGVRLVYPERRTDHEVELVAVIGREAKNISEEDALDYVCAYCIGLDMTVRGPEDRSFRKSPDSYTVLGPTLVTSDEVPDPAALDVMLTVNGVERQRANTSEMIVPLPRLIAIAASCYTLYPGDLIMSGTPDGVGEVSDGDVIVARIEGLGELRVDVRQDAGMRSIHGRDAPVRS